jgi:single-strand DNA-binding protein
MVANSLGKGRPVLVQGKLAQEEWEDKQGGGKRSKTKVTAFRITPLDWEDSQPSPTPKEAPIPEDDIPF